MKKRIYTLLTGILLAGAYLVFALAVPQIVHASIITVNTTDDELNADGDCSLREAIRAANTDSMVDTCTGGSGPDDIMFDAIVVPGTFALSISGTGEDAALTGDLDITEDLTITGAGAASTVIDGGALDRVFHVTPGATVQIDGVTITNGDANQGGGIWNNGTLVLNNSTVSGNTGGGGSGIFNSFGTITLTNSTISANTGGRGSGIFNNRGTITLTNSTISGNLADTSGGGLMNQGPMTILNITIVSNTATSTRLIMLVTTVPGISSC